MYVKEHKGLLSSLAHSAARTDKYRPETCCIIGNYYTLKAKRHIHIYVQKARTKERRKGVRWEGG